MRFVDTLVERRLFECGASVSIARAPGRLDVMGGIADYSGSLVLERPIAEATWAAVQRIDRPVLEIVSLGRDGYTIPLELLARDGAPVSYEEARRMFTKVRLPAFARSASARSRRSLGGGGHSSRLAVSPASIAA
jgi:Galactokinase galactose-binding signature